MQSSPTVSGAPAASTAPLWAVAVLTWVNSLGSGLLWSGIPFVTEHTYRFNESENLLLALVESVIYVGVALSAGPTLRRFGRGGLTARSWLAGIFVVQLISSLLVVVLPGVWGLLAAACALSAVGAAIWPVMESYVTSGRHGHTMRRALGVFNVTWMSATGAALLLMSPIIAAGYGGQTLLVLVPVALLSLALLRWFPSQPGEHSAQERHEHVPPGYRALLRATRFVVPVSYVFVAVISPILPFQLRDLGLDPALKTPLASVWMFARMGMVVLLAYRPFWHGRWSTLAVGVGLLAGGFAAMVLARDAWVMAAGLAAFGAGHGVLYYAAIYYAMAVGAAEVGAAGVFEALIGVGYVIGPVAGLLTAGESGALVGAVWSIAGVGLVPVVWTWYRARPWTAGHR